MKTRDAVLDIIALARTAQRVDLEAFQLLMPDNLKDSQRMLEVAVAILDAITSGPRQDRLFADIIANADGLEGELP